MGITASKKDKKIERVFSHLEEILGAMSNKKISQKFPDGGDKSFNPFFSSLSLKVVSGGHVSMLNGELVSLEELSAPNHKVRLEVRMGDYVLGGGVSYRIFDLAGKMLGDKWKKQFENEVNEAVWDCATDYARRWTDTFGLDNAKEKYVFFSKDKKSEFIGPERKISVDFRDVAENLRKLAKQVMHPQIYELQSKFLANRVDTYFINSEGSKIFQSTRAYCFHHTAKIPGPNNILLPNSVDYVSSDLGNLPSLSNMISDSQKICSDLFEIRNAPVEQNGLYPCIIDQDNFGVLMHELFGHCVEGHRVTHKDEVENEDCSKSTAFEGKIGKKVSPRFISVYDDPSSKKKNHDASYIYDEEGVEGKKVTLIKEGVLKNYLHSRQSAGYFGVNSKSNINSNGHSRCEPGNEPVPRMSNIIVESSNQVDYEQLKEELIKQVIKEKQHYGLFMIGTGGGESIVEKCEFESYPNHIYRIYKDGTQERVRGVYIVGTPYQVLNHILMTSDDYDTSKAFCGAESGCILSTQTAPHALLKRIEVNRMQKEKYEKVRNKV